MPVHKVADFMRNDPKIIFRDMALLKVISNEKREPKLRNYVKNLTQLFLTKVINQ